MVVNSASPGESPKYETEYLRGASRCPDLRAELRTRGRRVSYSSAGKHKASVVYDFAAVANSRPLTN